MTSPYEPPPRRPSHRPATHHTATTPRIAALAETIAEDTQEHRRYLRRLSLKEGFAAGESGDKTHLKDRPGREVSSRTRAPKKTSERRPPPEVWRSASQKAVQALGTPTDNRRLPQVRKPPTPRNVMPPTEVRV